MVSPLSSSSAFLNAGWFYSLRVEEERDVLYSQMLNLERERCKISLELSSGGEEEKIHPQQVYSRR